MTSFLTVLSGYFCTIGVASLVIACQWLVWLADTTCTGFFYATAAPQPIPIRFNFIFQNFDIMSILKLKIIKGDQFGDILQIEVITMENYSKDTFKIYVSLINMIKNNEKININNKLLNIEIESIPSNQLKFLIEMESCNSHQIAVKELEEIQRKLQTLCKSVLQNSEQVLASRKIYLKIKCFILVIYIKNNDLNNSAILVNKMISYIQDLQEMKYTLKILFRVESLLCLQRLDLSKLKKTSLKPNELQKMYYLISVIKLSNFQAESRKIINNFLDKTKYKEDIILQKTKVLRSIIKILLQKEKELIKLKKIKLVQEQPSRLMYHESTKKMIKNKLYVDYKIDLDDPRNQVQKKVQNLEEKIYLIVSPLFHFYYQNNNEIIERITQTQLHRKLGTAKSILVESLPLNSDSKIRRSKLRPTLKKNPLAYSLYLQQTAKNCQNVYSQVCGKGEMFIKHNFNNLYNSVKFVKLTNEELMWGKQKKSIDTNSTKIKMQQIMGIIYGRASSRHQQNDDDSAKQSLSFVMKERTLDLTVHLQKEKSQIYDFVLGASWIINQYHQIQKIKNESDLEALSNTSNQQQITNKIAYHKFKKQNMTRGQLLWSDLFSSLFIKTNKNVSKMMPKAKNIITLLGKSGHSSKILNRSSFNNSQTNSLTK